MSRVIKWGRPPQNAYIYICNTCESEIEFDPNDIQADPRNGDYVECPACHCFIAWTAVESAGKPTHPR